ncbi:hypothetical protein FOPG_17208 [Fusarium oxysporum f. sp. conglutinans race 2 54008]|uniref:HNH nuclease domain-containing protein n=3 Tax=Fusarium oxysporum f. sp. conglutinans TaxID=100902 RepID=A0A8H6G871_FUSOX|nr:hypothetical protein FOXB_04934 [Fusarium oxysporum f. sp. conglutinans Fo5176]EXL66639.1 hypothetical protein FOPG_17208 [Fusarium oxysporum f. sp. conglutinans race 2 54008]KAF6513011.1 hypothetical protein HZS61_007269 [Fusarium oxysporum f. sp. conglutinans]KAG7001694.1 hypothetical protein FocnCong_v011518 [Fusarium oxysporum f. sp. conglutinans]
MANAAVTPPMRVHGWNIHFLAGPDEFHFAGLFKAPNSDLITFQDVVDELRLCFNIPKAEPDRDPWDTIAFKLAKTPPGTTSDLPALVAGDDLSLPVPGLPARSPKIQSVVKYHVISHRPCNIASDKPLKDHLSAKCAQHISRPSRRLDVRYLPPNKPSSDPRYATMPFRRTAKGRTASQSPKRRSGSTSPTKENELEDIADLHMPPRMELQPDAARKTVETFRRNCLIDADRCAISGKGHSWCITPAIGPALQACHIIPQQHYHLYPDHHFQTLADEGDDVEFSAERLRQAWTNTWSNRNGILLMSHIHELFDARLVSIHPETHRIRAFVPYDVLTDFNGQQANLSDEVDQNALRHHYEMSCIENMAARMPLMTLDSPDVSAKTTPGIKTPLSGTLNLPVNTNPDLQRGDPSKRPRSDLETTTQRDVQHDEQQEPLSPETDMERDTKRRRVGDGDESSNVIYAGYGSLDHDPHGFLSDVNWKLRQLKAVQTAR